MRALLTSIMPTKNQEEFAERNDTDFAYEIPNLARFRATSLWTARVWARCFVSFRPRSSRPNNSAFRRRLWISANFRRDSWSLPGRPVRVNRRRSARWSIRSTNNRDDHIITIEDPIEFTHENQKCLVNQREVHNHTDSLRTRCALRFAKIRTFCSSAKCAISKRFRSRSKRPKPATSYSERLHTTTAASTVDRIIDQFPADRQQQIRVMLSESLKGVIAQTLLPKNGGGRVAALEVLDRHARHQQSDPRRKDVPDPSAMQTGKKHGMVMLNDALFEHVKNGLVDPLDAYIKAVDKTDFETNADPRRLQTLVRSIFTKTPRRRNPHSDAFLFWTIPA